MFLFLFFLLFYEPFFPWIRYKEQWIGKCSVVMTNTHKLYLFRPTSRINEHNDHINPMSQSTSNQSSNQNEKTFMKSFNVVNEFFQSLFVYIMIMSIIKISPKLRDSFLFVLTLIISWITHFLILGFLFCSFYHLNSWNKKKERKMNEFKSEKTNILKPKVGFPYISPSMSFPPFLFYFILSVFFIHD